MFDAFPKTRPPLPQEYQEIYAAHYRENREGGSVASSVSTRLEAWLHKRVAEDVATSTRQDVATLELGAGTLNQLDHEPVVGPYDVVEPFEELYRGSPKLARVRATYADIAEIPADTRYDRVTSVAVLEHVLDLPAVVASSGLLLNDGGVFRAGVPSEGTLLWTLGWRLTTGLEFRFKHGLDYSLLMRHEHVNSAAEMDEVLRFFFVDVRCRVFGLCKALSFYRYYEAHQPRLDRCTEFAAAR